MNGKEHKQYKYMYEEEAKTLCLYFSNEYIYYLDPLGAGAGNHMKFSFRNFELWKCEVMVVGKIL